MESKILTFALVTVAVFWSVLASSQTLVKKGSILPIDQNKVLLEVQEEIPEPKVRADLLKRAHPGLLNQEESNEENPDAAD